MRTTAAHKKAKKRENNRRYRLKNIEKARKASREYRIMNPSKMRDYGKQYRAKYPEKLKAKALRYKFSLSMDGYEALIRAQQGICAVTGCERPATAVDHDHGTGVVRGLLCHGCNAALGLLGECRQRMLGLAEYATLHGCKRREEAKVERAEEAMDMPLFTAALEKAGAK